MDNRQNEVSPIIRKNRIFLLFLVIVVSVMAGMAWRLRGLLVPKSRDIKQTVQFDERTGSVNVLVVGLDDLEGVNRSDTVAFVTVDIDNKIVKTMSIPRDTRTTIRGHGTQKINHAFVYGGVDLLKETVVNLLGMPIHYYVIINYQSFPKIVDTLGGVDIDVQKNLKYHDNAGGLHIDIKKGWRHMDGKTALEYVRFRHDVLGDIGRIQRQQQFLKALLKKVYDPSTMAQLPEVIKELLSVVQTDIPMTQGIQLGTYMKDISPENIFFMTMPGKSAVIDGVSYWSVDLLKTSTLLTSPISQDAVDAGGGFYGNEGGDDEKEALIQAITRPIAVLNGVGISGLGRSISSKLESLGIEVGYTGNARHFDYRYSSAVYSPGEENRQIALALAELCNIPKDLVKEDKGLSYAGALIIGRDKDRIISALER